MAEFEPGDVVVLKSGSMRMMVEAVEGESVRVLWANDGGIGRETLPIFALNKWEERPRPDFGDRGPRGGDGDRGPRRFGGDRDGGGKSFGGKPGGKPFGGKKPFGGPRGMDGKPRQKNFYRKDD